MPTQAQKNKTKLSKKLTTTQQDSIKHAVVDWIIDEEIDYKDYTPNAATLKSMLPYIKEYINSWNSITEDDLITSYTAV